MTKKSPRLTESILSSLNRRWHIPSLAERQPFLILDCFYSADFQHWYEVFQTERHSSLQTCHCSVFWQEHNLSESRDDSSWPLLSSLWSPAILGVHWIRKIHSNSLPFSFFSLSLSHLMV